MLSNMSTPSLKKLHSVPGGQDGDDYSYTADGFTVECSEPGEAELSTLVGMIKA